MSEKQRGVEAGGASAEVLLRRIFDIVSDEASRNPDLMMRLTREIAAAGQIETTGGRPAAPARSAKGRTRAKPKTAPKAAPEPEDDELAGFNPIAVVSDEGAAALRDHLRFVRKKDPLVRIAKRYALDVPKSVLQKKATLPATIDAIIEACERRIREQELSGG